MGRSTPVFEFTVADRKRRESEAATFANREASYGLCASALRLMVRAPLCVCIKMPVCEN